MSLGIFRSSDDIRTVCSSKVGDTSIDLPEANVILPLPKLASRKMSAIPTHPDIIISIFYILQIEHISPPLIKSSTASRSLSLHNVFQRLVSRFQNAKLLMMVAKDRGTMGDREKANVVCLERGKDSRLVTLVHSTGSLLLSDGHHAENFVRESIQYNTMQC